MCFLVSDGIIHWLWNIERGAGFMEKRWWFETCWVSGAYDTSKCTNIKYLFNIVSLGLIYKLGFGILIS